MANQVSRIAHDVGTELENPYDVLEIRKWATLEDIKRAYFTLVKKHPPELDPPGFMRVRKAYDRIKNNARRAKEDILLFNEIPGVISFNGMARQQVESLVKLNKRIKDLETLRERGALSENDRQDLIDHYKRRSMAYVSKDMWREAIRDWERLMEEGECRTEARRLKILGLGRLAYSYAKNERLDEAEKIWREVLELEPDNPQVNHNLAIAYSLLHRPKDEEKLWIKTLTLWRDELDKSDDDYLKNLIVETHKQSGGRYIKAMEAPPQTDKPRAPGEAAPAKPDTNRTVLSAVLAKSDFESVRDIGRACMEQKNYVQAIPAYERCLEMQPGDVSVLNDLAWAYLNTGNINKALALWNRATKLAPDNKEVRSSLVRAHVSIGRNLMKGSVNNQAFVHLRKAQQIDPDGEEVNEALAEAYYNKNDFQSAVDHWEKVLMTTKNRKQIQDKIREAKIKSRSYR